MEQGNTVPPTPTPGGGPHTSVNTDLRKIQTPENIENIFKQTCLFPCIKSFLKVHISLKVFTTASCTEISGSYFHHWINMTCEKCGEKIPNLKQLAQKIKMAKGKEILSRTLDLDKNNLTIIIQENAFSATGISILVYTFSGQGKYFNSVLFRI